MAGFCDIAVGIDFYREVVFDAWIGGIALIVVGDGLVGVDKKDSISLIALGLNQPDFGVRLRHGVGLVFDRDVVNAESGVPLPGFVRPVSICIGNHPRICGICLCHNGDGLQVDLLALKCLFPGIREFAGVGWGIIATGRLNSNGSS